MADEQQATADAAASTKSTSSSSDIKSLEAAAAERGKAVMQAASSGVSKIEEILAGWKSDMVHNTILSQDVEKLNYLVTVALPELQKRLRASLQH
jgi:flagellin-like hook-associated protein FlgL